MLKALFFIFLLPCFVGASEFGKSPISYFGENTKYGCVESGQCIIPRYDDVQEMKTEINFYAKQRIIAIDKIEQSALTSIEKYLDLAMEVQDSQGDNNFSQAYNEIYNALSLILKSKNVAESRTFVSEKSPVHDTLDELQIFIKLWNDKIAGEQDIEKKKELKILFKKAYAAHVTSKDFLFNINRMHKVNIDFVEGPKINSKESRLDEWFNTPYKLLNKIELINCPKQFRKLIDSYVGEIALSPNFSKIDSVLDPIKDAKYIKFILNSKQDSERALRVKCKRVKGIRGYKVKYSSKKHSIDLKWKMKGKISESTIFSEILGRKFRISSMKMVQTLLKKHMNKR